MSEERIDFQGPYSWPGMPDAPSVFDCEFAGERGIYLWTVRLPEGHLVYYVGQTARSFYVRLREHYMGHASGMYHVNAPAEFARGEKVMLWPGLFDPNHRRTATEWISAYAQLAGPIAELTRIYRFLLAPLSCDMRRLNRIEAAMADILSKGPGMVGAFQERGVHYSRRWPKEEPFECVVTASEPLLGLPARFEA